MKVVRCKLFLSTKNYPTEPSHHVQVPVKVKCLCHLSNKMQLCRWRSIEKLLKCQKNYWMIFCSPWKPFQCPLLLMVWCAWESERGEWKERESERGAWRQREWERERERRLKREREWVDLSEVSFRCKKSQGPKSSQISRQRKRRRRTNWRNGRCNKSPSRPIEQSLSNQPPILELLIWSTIGVPRWIVLLCLTYCGFLRTDLTYLLSSEHYLYSR